MKKYFYILPVLMLCSSLLLHAQISITSANLPEAGFTYIVYNDTVTIVNIGSPSSSAQNWNFSGLQNHYQTVPTYDSTKFTPYASTFTTSTHYTYGPAALYSGLAGAAPVGTQGMNNGYMFWREDVNGFHVVGFRSDNGSYANQNVFYSPQELLIGTPATYNSSFTNACRWQIWFNANPGDVDTLYVCNINKTLVVDAFGSLTTPVFVNAQVIRMKEHRIKVDSVYAYMMGNPVYAMELARDTANNYMFLSNAHTYPLCTVHCTSADAVKNVEYYFMNVVAGTENSGKEQEAISFYPNPVAHQLQISLPASQEANAVSNVKIFNSEGKLIKSINRREKNISVDTESLPAGLYFFILENKGKVQSGKFIKSE